MLSRDDDASSTRPKPSMLRALQNMSWTVHGAVAELVDNGFGQGRGAATQVTILWNPQKRILEVLDNGVGMTAIRDLFRMGETVGRHAADIGEYGSGGTMALLYLGVEIMIWTLRDDMVAQGSVRWNDWFMADDFPNVPTHWKRASAKTVPELLWRKGHGTLIQIKVLKRRKVSESQIRRDLSAIYAPAVRNGCVLRWITAGQDAIDLSDPIGTLEDGIDIDLTLELKNGHDVQHLHVTGAIGRVQDLPIERSRVAVSFFHRVIKWTRECYSHSSGRKYPGVGVCGWLHLDDSWQGLLSTTKDSIDDSDAWEALTDAVFERIEPLLKKVDHDKKVLLLDNIAMELSRIFSEANKTLPALLGEEDPEGDGIGQGNLLHGDGEGGDEGDGRSRSRRKHGDQEEGVTAVVSKLEVIFMSDVELDRHLCRAEIEYRNDNSTNVIVFVNGEHNTIKVAIEEHPVNRMALAILVAQAVALQVVVHPPVLRAWFGRKLAKHIEEQKSEFREPLVLRLLMDRFRNMPRAS